MDHSAILYLNHNQVLSGTIGRTALPRDYVLACQFFHCGIIDRTHTLDTGFTSTVLDVIPSDTGECLDFGALCDARGVQIVTEATGADRQIDVLWSGGIDSTTALIAITKAASHFGCVDRVNVLLSMDSVLENPRFFLNQIKPRIAIRSCTQPVSAYLDTSRLSVTGEHGDQLFGSQLLEPWVRRGLAGADFQDILPVLMLERLRNPLNVRRVLRYLTPVLEAAPVPLRSLFDALWWLNFSLKWQDVTLRLAAITGAAAGPVYQTTRHFFRTDDFQRWAMRRRGLREAEIWARYKDEAKRYVLAHTGDDRYYQLKEKEDSLRKVMSHRRNPERYQIFMRDDFRPVIVGVPRLSGAHAAQAPRRLPAVAHRMRRSTRGG